MERKQFLLTTLTALPALAFAHGSASRPGNTEPFVVRAGGSRFNQPMKYRGLHPNDIIISRKDTGNALSLFVYTGYDKIGPPLHVHFEQDELFYVVEGSYRFVVGSQTHELQPGDTIFLPRGLPHTWLQLTARGRLVYGVQPAGTLEDFFMELSAMTKAPTDEELQQIHLKHGMKVVGPPLSL